MSPRARGTVQKRRKQLGTFAKVIDYIIVANNLSLTEAAERAGVTTGAMSRWRSGAAVTVDEKCLRTMCKKFGIDFESLCVIAFSSKYPFLKEMFRTEPRLKTVVEGERP